MSFKNDREFWIYVQTVLDASPMAKNLNRDQITTLAEFIRSKHCPNLSNDEIREIKKSITESKYVIMETFANGISKAMGGKSLSPKEFEELRNLDSNFKDIVGNIDLKEIEAKLKDSKINNPDLQKALEMAKSFQNEKKEFKKNRG